MVVSKRFLFATTFVGWMVMGRVENNKSMKRYAFNKGYNFSQKFKKYWVWDACVEPVIVRQSYIVFTFGNAFIKGMISDNEEGQKKEIMERYKEKIEEELKE